MPASASTTKTPTTAFSPPPNNPPAAPGQLIRRIKYPLPDIPSGEAPQLRRFFSFFLSPASDAGSSWWLRRMPSGLIPLPSSFFLTYLSSFASSFPQKSVQLSETPLGLSCLSLTSGICFYSSGLIFHFPFSIAQASLLSAVSALSARHKIQSVQSMESV